MFPREAAQRHGPLQEQHPAAADKLMNDYAGDETEEEDGVAAGDEGTDDEDGVAAGDEGKDVVLQHQQFGT